MSKSISNRTAAHAPIIQPDDVKVLLDAVLADLTALRAAHLLLTAKLDLDATVTDTNYASLTNPAALTLLS